jgi:hypothetical protein
MQRTRMRASPLNQEPRVITPGLLALRQWVLNDTARNIPDKISLSNLILFPDAPSCLSR